MKKHNKPTPTKEIFNLAVILRESECEWIKRDSDPEHFPDNPENHFIFMAERVFLWFSREQDIR